MLKKIMHFNVKEGKDIKFQKWILENQENYTKVLPPGWKYLGCYGTVFHMGRFEFQMEYEIDNFAAYDALRAYENKEHNRFLTEIFDFINPNIPIEIEVVRSVGEVKIIGERE